VSVLYKECAQGSLVCASVRKASEALRTLDERGKVLSREREVERDERFGNGRVVCVHV
jgi:hypothetical protein